MISADLRKVAICLAETHKNYPEALPELVTMFAGIIATTQRQLLAHLGYGG